MRRTPIRRWKCIGAIKRGRKCNIPASLITWIIRGTRRVRPLRRNSVNINTLHGQPESERQLPDEGWYEDGRKYPAFKVGREKQGEAIREIAQPGDLQQDAEHFRKIPGPENKVPHYEAPTSEKDQAQAEAIAIQFHRQVHHGSELPRQECFQVLNVRQRKQSRNENELKHGFDR